MKNKIIIILLLFIGMFFSVLFSQEKDIEPKNKELGIAYTFADNVNVRDKTSTSGKVLFQLKVGDKIEIIENTGSLFKVDNASDYWYKIKKDRNTGYIWGGFIANVTVVDFNSKGTLLLIRDLARKMNEKGNIEFKLVEKNKILHTYNYETYGNYNLKGYKIYDDSGFNPRVKLIGLAINKDLKEGNYEFTLYRELYFFVKENKINFIVEVTLRGYENTNTIAFPSDPDGEPNKLIVTESSEGYYRNIVYIWNGDSFVIKGNN